MTRSLALVVLLLSLAATPSFGAEANCNMFSFDATRDSPHIEILDFRYGTSGAKGTFAEAGKPVPQYSGVVQGGLKGDRLMVKWKNRKTNKVFTKDIALKGHLPNYDKTTCDIFFAIKKDQLYVFMLTQEERPKNWPPVDTNPEPIVTDYLKVFIVYPYGKKTVD